MSQFTWLPFFEEMLSVICSKYDKQSLSVLLPEIFADTGSLTDQSKDRTPMPLQEIDPLTFIGYFNRKITNENRVHYCELAKGKMGLKSLVPSDFDAIPNMNNQNSWFFDYSYKRGEQDIDHLWQFSQSLNKGSSNDDLFRSVLNIRKVGISKLTALMFICKPNTYISMDDTNLSYISAQGCDISKDARILIKKSSEPYSTYMEMVDKIRNTFPDKSFYEISHNAYLDRKNPPPPDPTKRYWAISPGRNASFWDDFKSNNLIAIGWDKLGDLSRYGTKDEIRSNIVKLYGDDTSKKNNALACHEFAKVMKIGDIVFIKKGYNKVIAYGEVVSDYQYDPSRTEFQHTREVKWISEGNWDTPKDSRPALKALTDMTPYPIFVKSILDQASGGVEKPTIPPTPIYTQADALKDLFLSEQKFKDILNALIRKKNIILSGPPGVGKTFIAKRIAYTLIGKKDPQKVQMIQFHQSYSYEDFIQGYRPNDEGKFILKNGVFYEFCKKAHRNKDEHYVFIIDEINRGNLSKIFGELMMLLEADKRGSEYAVPLTYAQDPDDTFYIPANVYFIGTMNTADRSLAMVDYALRRRFSFITLEPCFESSQYRNHLKTLGVQSDTVEKIITRMTALNQQISSDQKNLGDGYRIGHSFFCPDGNKNKYAEDWYNMVITQEVEPLIREYWFDDSDKAEAAIKDLRR